MLQQRTDEILKAVDILLTVHDAWEADETAPVQPTAAFEDAINAAVIAGDNGDVPERCRDLCLALQRLGVEWDLYVNGLRTPDHRPIGRFWGTFRDVIHARAGAQATELKRPEPVSLLIEQKVPHHQIARHIWGYQGKGPFITSIGQVDSTKILEEAKEPGKHTKDWVHPEQLMRQRDNQRELSRRLGNATRRQEVDQKVVEKASIVEMLKEGQYPDVIARVKGVTLDVVLQEARTYSITPAVRPNLASERAPQEPPVFGSDIEVGASDTDLDPDAEVELDQETEETEESEGTEETPLADLILSFADGKRGPAEIVAAVREAGREVTFQQVKAALKEAKTAAAK